MPNNLSAQFLPEKRSLPVWGDWLVATPDPCVRQGPRDSFGISTRYCLPPSQEPRPFHPHSAQDEIGAGGEWSPSQEAGGPDFPPSHGCPAQRCVGTGSARTRHPAKPVTCSHSDSGAHMSHVEMAALLLESKAKYSAQWLLVTCTRLSGWPLQVPPREQQRQAGWGPHRTRAPVAETHEPRSHRALVPAGPG